MGFHIISPLYLSDILWNKLFDKKMENFEEETGHELGRKVNKWESLHWE